MAGLLSCGVGVVDFGMMTTPAMQFLLRQTRASGGIMVTASHNPPEYNGFKVVDADGIEIPRQKEERIERLMQQGSWSSQVRTGSIVRPVGLLDHYLDKLMASMGSVEKSLRGTRLVVDAGNGVAAITTPKVLMRLGCDVLTVNDNIDGRFPGRPSEPRPDTLEPLSRLVIEQGADFGVAHDGDGDRAIFVDDKGKFQWGDKTFALVVDEVLKQHPGAKVVTPVNSSMSVGDIAKDRGGELILTKVGSIHVSRKMVETGAVLGGEENGGIFYAPHLPVRDGTMAVLLVLKCIAENGLPLSKLLTRLPRFFMAKEKFACDSEEKKTRTIVRLKALFGKRVTSELDGVRVDVKDKGWLLVRTSGTEPLIRFYAEGRTEQDLSEILNEFRPTVQKALQA